MRKNLVYGILVFCLISICSPTVLLAEESDRPDWLIPFTRETSIFGEPEVTRQQMVDYIMARNPSPSLSCSLEELVDLYYEEAGVEGIRPDLALCQAIKETGYFAYGGDVVPEQNNYCGLGTTGGGVKGAYFATPREGVRAQIQHLLAYSSPRLPFYPIVDPRYELLKEYRRDIFGKVLTWEGLSGRWAVPGINYGRQIVNILEDVKKKTA